MKHVVEDSFINDLEIYHDIQPIINLNNNKVIGYEFLLRSKNVKSPEALFSYAMEKNKLYDLDIKSIFKVIGSIQNQSAKLENILLFINVFPSTLTEVNFYNCLLNTLSVINIKPESVVLEINEAEKGLNISVFKEAISKYKKQGFVISLDDIGKGESTIKAIIEIEPNIAKVDRYFSKDLASSPKKQEIIKHLLLFLEKKPQWY